ncbi:MAG: o-succinylbenzoate--CoA ligase [bacterium]|nr:o-succinylbenzoate--CoA ligase [bacterium]
MPDATFCLDEAANRFRETPALIDGARVLSFRDFAHASQGVTMRLSDKGFVTGDRLAMVLPTSIDAVVLLMGCMRAGVSACPLNPRLPATAVVDAVMRMDARGVVSEAESKDVSVESIRPEDLLGELATGREPRALDDEDIATITMTSGSTGTPKAAALTLRNHLANARASNANIRLAPGDCWLLSLPLYHVAGLGVLFRCMLGGATVVVPEPDDDLAACIERYRVTHVSLVTTQLRRTLGVAGGAATLRRLKAILLGGSAIPESLTREAVEEGLNLFTTYGLTEMASQATTTSAGASIDDLLTSGRPLSPNTVRISDAGEIEVCGDTLFAGYWTGTGLERPLADDGWFVTGDLGAFDDERRLRVLGRHDNLFVSGGENMHPEEIERRLCALEGIVEAVVVPVDDDEFGARPVAFVRTEDSVQPDAAQLTASLEAALPRFEIPVAFHPWPERVAEGMKVNRGEFVRLAEDLRAGG